MIDIGKTQPDKLIFRYRNHKLEDKDTHNMTTPLDLILGKDYTAITGFKIGSLPYATYPLGEVSGDTFFFVDDVWFTTP